MKKAFSPSTDVEIICNQQDLIRNLIILQGIISYFCDAVLIQKDFVTLKYAL